MNRKIIALVASLAASAAFVPVAEAGGGIRLGFGGPMGSFVATPRGGSGGYAAVDPSCHKPKKPVQLARQSSPEPVKVASKKRSTPVTSSSNEKDTASTTEQIPTGSTALIQTAPSTASLDPAPASSTDQSATTASSTTETTTNVAAAAPATAEPATTAKAETKAESETKDVGCKKFIPAIGLTVSVGCKK